jgi:hypothetical protein
MPPVVTLMFLLSETPMTAMQIARLFRVSDRQGKRLVDRLEDFGFIIEKKDRYFHVKEWPEHLRKFKPQL